MSKFDNDDTYPVEFQHGKRKKYKSRCKDRSKHVTTDEDLKLWFSDMTAPIRYAATKCTYPECNCHVDSDICILKQE